MSTKTIFNLMWIALATLIVGCSNEERHHDIVINNVTVIDAASTPRQERSVVIRDDKIFAVNPRFEGRRRFGRQRN